MARTKNEAFLQDVIVTEHPIFKKNPSLRKLVLSNPEWFNIEYLYEETNNIRSGYTKTASKTAKVDATKGKRKKEYKTGTVSDLPIGNSNNCFRLEITAIESKAGKLKDAPIVASVHNKIKDCVDHFFFPQKDLPKLRNSGGKKGQGKIVGSYNQVKDTYGVKLEKYRVSFTELVAV